MTGEPLRIIGLVVMGTATLYVVCSAAPGPDEQAKCV